ncbi:hypothetical protein LTR36_006832 [Oleoguttula mirabilis]|uniref:BTB domain-containing protein n=1 Tax=Oleoguttula mirabilis TaxID=1507867 RepID=A0AAV9JDA2_9PEZI|nr:hypothetical protein LTR36_006832 [Oleoguttula mirabilis]
MADAEDLRTFNNATINPRESMVTVKVGIHKFVVHRHLLIDRSQYFTEKLNNGTTIRVRSRPTDDDIEDDDDDGEDDDDDCEDAEGITFEIYVKYLYSGKIQCEVGDGGEDHDGSLSNAEYKSLCRLFILAEKVQDVTL